MIGVIKGTGSAVPCEVIHNRDLETLIDTSDEWIQERTGVINRHVIGLETTSSMAVEASKAALENGNIDATELDMIVVATISSDVIMPSTACVVQSAIGAEHAVCFDMNAACSGFVFAYNTVQAYMELGMVKTALVVGSESLSNLVDWTDRGTCILFGDGAGAVVLEASDCTEHAVNAPRFIMHSMGSKGDALKCEHQYCAEYDSKSDTFLKMDGQEVFKFAIRKVPQCIEELIEIINEQQEVNIQNIDYFILHQANKRIVEAVAKRLGVEIEKFPMNLMEYGNTSSASIPILLDEMNQKGILKSGMKIIMAGFGAGLTWGATYIEWK